MPSQPPGTDNAHLNSALEDANAALESHDQHKLAAASLKLQMAQLNLQLGRGNGMPATPSNGIGPMGTIVSVLVGVAAIVGLATTLMNSRVDDLGERVGTIEGRLVNIDSGISDLRVQMTELSGKLDLIASRTP